VFLLAPYAVNVYFAVTIKTRIYHNAFAAAWFNAYSKWFTSLVIFTGACHSALCLVSSNLFGHKMLSSGLTRHELLQNSKLARLRIIGNICMENVPQIIIQFVYVLNVRGEMETAADLVAVVFAFIASLLSILTGLASFCMERQSRSLINVAKYYVSLTIDQHASSEDRTITKQEKRSIVLNKGRRSSLAHQMAQIFGVPPNNIAVGGATVSKYGVVLFVVQYMNEERGLIATHLPALYSRFAQQMNRVLRTHFNLGRQFVVTFHEEMPDLILGLARVNAGAVQLTYNDRDLDGDMTKQMHAAVAISNKH